VGSNWNGEKLVQLGYKERPQRTASLRRIRVNSNYLMRTTCTLEDGLLDRNMLCMSAMKERRMDSKTS
jgi:hypothetical protein